MSSEPSWKKSSQKKTFNNLKTDTLNYQDGKWKDVNVTQSIGSNERIINKIVQKKENQDVVVGINTDQPYSRLSLGDNSGTVNNSILLPSTNLYSGERSSIALQEDADGKNLHGFTYLEDLVKKSNIDTIDRNSGIGISTDLPNTEQDPQKCAVYIDSQNCVTINSIPRNLDNNTLTRGSGGDPVNPQIMLDVNGSIRVDGFISFIPNFMVSDENNKTYIESLNNPNEFNFPKGAMFVANINDEPKLFIIDQQGQPKDVVGTIKLEDISTDGGTATGGLTNVVWQYGLRTGTQVNPSPPFDLRYQYGSSNYPSRLVLDYRGRSESNVIWSSVVANTSFTNEYDLPDNILTAAGGNIVILSDGKTIERGTSSGAAGRSNAELSAYLTENVFKIVGSNQKITNADNNYGNVTLGVSFTPDVNYTRGGNLWIERQLTIGPNNGNRLLAMIDIGGQYQGIPAINIGTKQKVVAATNSIIIGEQEEADSIGNNEDCMNTIIMGKNKKIDINTSIIGGSRNEVFGLSNTTQRNIGIPISDATGNSPYHNNSIIFGNNNKIRGTQNYVFGQHNKVGEQTSGGINDNLVFNSFIAGQNNSIKKQTADNLDTNANALKPIDNETYVLLGSNASIDLNPMSNTSDIRFAFGTATQNGNVFTIDKNGNVVIGNDLDVNGEVSIGNVTLGSDASDTITISGSTNIKTDLTPDATQTVNVGKTTNRFNNVYLKTNSVIDFGGDTTLTHSAGNLTLNTKLTAATGSSVGDLTLANGSITDSSGAIDFGDENLSTAGTLDCGVLTAATGSSVGDLTLANGSITDSSGAISFGDENLSTAGTLDCGVLTAATGSSVGDLTLANGSITDSSGAIDFGDENLSTAGTLDCGVLTAATGSSVGDLTLANGSITDSSGAIDFGDENLSTAGTLDCGVLTAATGSSVGDLTLANGSITDSSGAIDFGDENLSTAGTLDCGVLTAATGSSVGDLTLANGSITDSSGAISFGDESLSTTGQ